MRSLPGLSHAGRQRGVAVGLRDVAAGRAVRAQEEICSSTQRRCLIITECPRLSGRQPDAPKAAAARGASILRHGLLGNSAFARDAPLQNKRGSALDITPVTESVLRFEVLSQPAGLIQFSSEISLILLFLRKIMTIFRVPLHFLRIQTKPREATVFLNKN